MGLFSKNDGGLSDVIRCDEQDYLIWKWHPQGTTSQSSKRANSIRWGSSLRVRDGSAAVFVYKKPDGSLQEYIEGPCDKVIETKNLPILASLVGTLFQGNSPFQAEIYFINKASTIQLDFGVGPVDAFDPRFRDTPVPAKVRGTLNFRISDVSKFVSCHSLAEISPEVLNVKIRSLLIGRIKSVISQAAPDHGITLVAIESKIPEIEELLEDDVRDKLYSDYGVELVSVNISAIEIDKTSKAYKKLEKMTQGKGTTFAHGVLNAFGSIKSQIAGEKKLSKAEKEENSETDNSTSGKRGGLFGKKNKVAPPPIPTAGYYVAVDGKQKGPYDLSKIKKMMLDGSFNSESLVWKEGWEGWVKASEVEEMNTLFQMTPPPLPGTDTEE